MFRNIWGQCQHANKYASKHHQKFNKEWSSVFYLVKLDLINNIFTFERKNYIICTWDQGLNLKETLKCKWKKAPLLCK